MAERANRGGRVSRGAQGRQGAPHQQQPAPTSDPSTARLFGAAFAPHSNSQSGSRPASFSTRPRSNLSQASNNTSQGLNSAAPSKSTPFQSAFGVPNLNPAFTAQSKNHHAGQIQGAQSATGTRGSQGRRGSPPASGNRGRSRGTDRSSNATSRQSSPAGRGRGESRGDSRVKGRGEVRGEFRGGGRGESRGDGQGSGRSTRGSSRTPNQFLRGSSGRVQRPSSLRNQTSAATTPNAWSKNNEVPTLRSMSRRAGNARTDQPIPNVTRYHTNRYDPTSRSHKSTMAALMETLRENRVQEREWAIRNNLIMREDSARSLMDAVALQGTCGDMCPEFERVTRIVQNGVDTCEMEELPDHTMVPSEKKMVKRFERSSAGKETPLPSDVRPVEVLKMTADYLLDEVVFQAADIAQVHTFVWDRTRAIRTDFTIQHVEDSSLPELEMAIYCFERIARFHFASLHYFARPGVEKPGQYDTHQEMEQLVNTLKSLWVYYEIYERFGAVIRARTEFSIVYMFAFVSNKKLVHELLSRGDSSLLSARNLDIQDYMDLRSFCQNDSALEDSLKPGASSVVERHPSCIILAERLLANEALPLAVEVMAEMVLNQLRASSLGKLHAAFASNRSTMMDATLPFLTQYLQFHDEEETLAFMEHVEPHMPWEVVNGVQCLDLSKGSTKMRVNKGAGQPWLREIDKRLSGWKFCELMSLDDDFFKNKLDNGKEKEPFESHSLLWASSAVPPSEDTPPMPLELRGKDWLSPLPRKSSNLTTRASWERIGAKPVIYPPKAQPSPFPPEPSFPSLAKEQASPFGSSPNVEQDKSSKTPFNASPIFSNSLVKTTSKASSSNIFSTNPNDLSRSIGQPNPFSQFTSSSPPSVLQGAAPSFTPAPLTNIFGLPISAPPTTSNNFFSKDSIPSTTSTVVFPPSISVANEISQPLQASTFKTTSPVGSNPFSTFKSTSMATSSSAIFGVTSSELTNPGIPQTSVSTPASSPFAFLRPKEPMSQPTTIFDTAKPITSKPIFDTVLSASPPAGQEPNALLSQPFVFTFNSGQTSVAPASSATSPSSQVSPGLQSNSGPARSASPKATPTPAIVDGGPFSKVERSPAPLPITSTTPNSSPQVTKTTSSPQEVEGSSKDEIDPESLAALNAWHSNHLDDLDISIQEEEGLAQRAGCTRLQVSRWLSMMRKGSGSSPASAINVSLSNGIRGKAQPAADSAKEQQLTPVEREVVPEVDPRFVDGPEWDAGIQQRGLQARAQLRESAWRNRQWTPFSRQKKNRRGPHQANGTSEATRELVYAPLPLSELFLKVVHKEVVKQQAGGGKWAMAAMTNDPKTNFWLHNKFGVYDKKDPAGSVARYLCQDTQFAVFGDLKPRDADLLTEIGCLVYSCSADYTKPSLERFNSDRDILHGLLRVICENSRYKNVALTVLCYRSPLDDVETDDSDLFRSSGGERSKRLAEISRRLDFQSLPANIIGREVVLIENVEDLSSLQSAMERLVDLVPQTMSSDLADFYEAEASKEKKIRDAEFDNSGSVLLIAPPSQSSRRMSAPVAKSRKKRKESPQAHDDTSSISSKRVRVNGGRSNTARRPRSSTVGNTTRTSATASLRGTPESSHTSPGISPRSSVLLGSGFLSGRSTVSRPAAVEEKSSEGTWQDSTISSYWRNKISGVQDVLQKVKEQTKRKRISEAEIPIRSAREVIEDQRASSPPKRKRFSGNSLDAALKPRARATPPTPEEKDRELLDRGKRLLASFRANERAEMAHVREQHRRQREAEHKAKFPGRTSLWERSEVAYKRHLQTLQAERLGRTSALSSREGSRGLYDMSPAPAPRSESQLASSSPSQPKLQADELKQKPQQATTAPVVIDILSSDEEEDQGHQQAYTRETTRATAEDDSRLLDPHSFGHDEEYYSDRAGLSNDIYEVGGDDVLEEFVEYEEGDGEEEGSDSVEGEEEELEDEEVEEEYDARGAHAGAEEVYEVEDLGAQETFDSPSELS